VLTKIASLQLLSICKPWVDKVADMAQPFSNLSETILRKVGYQSKRSKLLRILQVCQTPVGLLATFHARTPLRDEIVLPDIRANPIKAEVLQVGDWRATTFAILSLTLPDSKRTAFGASTNDSRCEVL
jgi:hypothetical protein